MWPLSDLGNWYSWLFYDIADPRTRDFAFLGSPVPMILFYGSYLILCMKIIPRFMENRKPIRLQQSSWILECVCFLMSLFFVIRGWKIWMRFNWRCEPIDFSRSEEAMEMVNLCWYFLMSKKVYIIESVVCVLRKDVSYMRNYLFIHHIMVPILFWLLANYAPSGHLTLECFILSVAHAPLFAFYLIYKRLLGRKSALCIYVGIFFLVFQFVASFLLILQLFIWNDCNFPLRYASIGLALIILFVLLIIKFVVLEEKERYSHTTKTNAQIFKENYQG